MQLRGRGLGPQGCEVDGVQRGLGRLQGLCGPRGQRGLHLGLHGGGGGGRWRCGLGFLCGCGLDACLQLQLRRCRGQRAPQRGVRAQLDGRSATGHSGAHRAVHRGVQRQGCLGLQCQPRVVLALGQLHAADVQSVLAPIKVVVARQAPGFHRRGACPLQLVHAKGHADVQGQHQLGGGRGGRGTLRAAQWRDLHACGPYFAQLQPALQQGRQLPAQAQVGHFDGQAGAAPAQPADAPTAAQRAGDLAAFQLLLGGQVLRCAGQRGGQRRAAARPPPQQRAGREQQGHQRHQQPAQGPQHAVSTWWARWARALGR